MEEHAIPNAPVQFKVCLQSNHIHLLDLCITSSGNNISLSCPCCGTDKFNFSVRLRQLLPICFFRLHFVADSADCFSAIHYSTLYVYSMPFTWLQSRVLLEICLCPSPNAVSTFMNSTQNCSRGLVVSVQWRVVVEFLVEATHAPASSAANAQPSAISSGTAEGEQDLVYHAPRSVNVHVLRWSVPISVLPANPLSLPGSLASHRVQL
jgi:hypothetical protein